MLPLTRTHRFPAPRTRWSRPWVDYNTSPQHSLPVGLCTISQEADGLIFLSNPRVIPPCLPLFRYETLPIPPESRATRTAARHP